MTDPDPADPHVRAILVLAAARGEVVLAGNKEHFAFIRRKEDVWLRTDGDPMTGEQEIRQIDDAAVARAIYWRAREMLGHYGPDDDSVGWDGILDWLRSSHI